MCGQAHTHTDIFALYIYRYIPHTDARQQSFPIKTVGGGGGGGGGGEHTSLANKPQSIEFRYTTGKYSLLCSDQHPKNKPTGVDQQH